jgi:hypothetical protein
MKAFEVVCIEGVRHRATKTRLFPPTDSTADIELITLTVITAVNERTTGQEALAVELTDIFVFKLVVLKPNDKYQIVSSTTEEVLLNASFMYITDIISYM